MPADGAPLRYFIGLIRWLELCSKQLPLFIRATNKWLLGRSSMSPNWSPSKPGDYNKTPAADNPGSVAAFTGEIFWHV
jgi:hypothetical protein